MGVLGNWGKWVDVAHWERSDYCSADGRGIERGTIVTGQREMVERGERIVRVAGLACLRSWPAAYRHDLRELLSGKGFNPSLGGPPV